MRPQDHRTFQISLYSKRIFKKFLEVFTSCHCVDKPISSDFGEGFTHMIILPLDMEMIEIMSMAFFTQINATKLKV